MLPKVLIIGSGPSACALAYFLNEPFEVLIAEAGSLPRNKPCGGILIEESVEFLKELNPTEEVFAKPKTLLLNYLDWNNNLQFTQERGFQNIDRKAFDNWLLEKVKKKPNLQIIANARVESFSEKGDKFTVNIKKNDKIEHFEADFIVDASGAFSFTRKEKPTVYNAVQFTTKLTEETRTFDCILASELNDYYSWRIPKNDCFVIGSAFPSNVSAKIEVFKKKFAEKLGVKSFENLQAAPIIKPNQPKDICLTKNNCFILGEAAGLISASTGEGISYALRSGKECAKAINNNPNNLNNALREYENNCDYLVKDVLEKISRAKLFASPKARLGFFKSFQK